VKSFVASERAALCDLFDRVGPDHPTLCEGWLTHDLAVHLWIRENDMVGAGGLVIKPLAGVLERRMAATKQRWSYAELVDRLRQGPPRWSPMGIPPLDVAVNTAELYVHHEDVRRAGEAVEPARILDREVEDWIWRRLGTLARPLFRRARVGVVLERLGSGGDHGDPQTIRAVPGASTVTLAGLPSELLLYANGRTCAAEVKLIGEPDAIDILHAADLRI
jgi:uncharacterized protein (TIGR03085 family)